MDVTQILVHLDFKVLNTNVAKKYWRFPLAMIAFQGGGAKLGELLAVASAVRQAEFRVTRLAGTSAGSIAASVLAAERNPIDLCNHFRANEASILNRLQKKVPRLKGLMGLLYRVGLKGQPYIDPKFIREIFGECFESLNLDRSTKVGDLAIPTSIVAADLISKKPHVFGDETLLIDALVSSSSLPLIFANFSDSNSHLVDGGLFANLPVDVLLSHLSTDGDVIAISFDQDFAFEARSSVNYIGGMLSSIIDAKTVDSISRVGPENVYSINSEVKSFSVSDFFGFLKGESFQSREDDARAWLRSWRSRSASQYGDYRPIHQHDAAYAEYLSSKSIDMGELLGCKDNKKVLSLDLLIEPQINEEFDGLDAVTTTFALPIEGSCEFSAYSCYTITDSENIKFVSAEWSVYDDKGDKIPHVAIPVREPGDKKTSIVLLFKCSDCDDRIVKVTQKQLIHNLMGDLVSGKEDFFKVVTSENEDISELTLRLATKRAMGALWQRPDGKTRGSELKVDEMSGGRTTLCWHVTDLEPGEEVYVKYGQDH